MAAENYSDVVQALAREIVDTCMAMMRKNFQGMLSGVTINADQIEGEVVNVDGTNVIVDAGNVTGLNQYVASLIAGSRIDINQIASIGEDGKLYLNDVYINTAQVADLEAQFAHIWEAQIDKAEIQQALIDKLRANLAEIVHAEIQEANIDAANITNLTAISAEIADIVAESATINWAHIESLTAGKALFEKGVGGKLYVADLAVTEANMVNLTVGQLVVKGQDGGYYQITVTEDAEGNPVVGATERMQIGNDEVSDLSIDGDSKLIEGSITAKTLNVQDIFANNAMILSLIAKNIDVDELFAREAFINKLNTTDISGNEYLQLTVNSAKQEIVDMVALRLTDESIVATVTQSAAFQKEMAEVATPQTAITYQASTSGVTPPDDEDGWLAEIPEVRAGDYLWTRTVNTYANGTTSTAYSVAQQPINGEALVIRIGADSGTVIEQQGDYTLLTADVYYGAKKLTRAQVNAIGAIRWYQDGVRIKGEDWRSVKAYGINASTPSVYAARLEG